ncbi:MAG: DUF3488 domain-containing protein, partial [Rhodocyclaceae bacterium]|nr:DUF3488 domain-containing protein [Rhodocyclaceae bacterium]
MNGRLRALAAQTWPVERWLHVLVAVCVCLHGGHLPLGVSGCALALLAVRVFGRREMPRALRLLLAGAAVLLVFVSFGYLLGKEPGVALLVLLLCLKLFERSGGARDVWATLLLVFFLLLALLLYGQTPRTLVAVTFCFWLAGCALMQMQDAHLTVGRVARLSARQLLGGMAAAAVLFFIVPRVEGPLWGLPRDALRGVSGLSDSMSPGSLSELVLSDELVMIAEFDGAIPPAHWRYWRGPVLEDFDGRTWHHLPSRPQAAPRYTPSGVRFRYQLALQAAAGGQRWLLAMDFPAAGVAGARYSAEEFTLLASRATNAPRSLTLEAWPQTPVGADLRHDHVQRSLILPARGNARTRALAAELRAQAAGEDARIVELASDFFRTNALQYTLTPAPLGNDSVDEFLFVTREGFCEHFASAFVFLLRAAGVPARVVAGYLGGQPDPTTNSLLIRQSDAHAWTEVWLQGRGWVRVDPTALAVPGRVQGGLRAAVPDEQLPLMLRARQQWLRDLRAVWEGSSRLWNEWVIGLDTVRQQRVWDWLHIGAARALWLGLFGVPLTAALCGFAWARWRAARADPVQRLWHHFCRKLARRGMARQPWEGPLDYGVRAAAVLPARSAEIDAIVRLYARLCYGAHLVPDADEISRLAQLVRRFR